MASSSSLSSLVQQYYEEQERYLQNINEEDDRTPLNHNEIRIIQDIAVTGSYIHDWLLLRKLLYRRMNEILRSYQPFYDSTRRLLPGWEIVMEPPTMKNVLYMGYTEEDNTEDTTINEPEEDQLHSSSSSSVRTTDNHNHDQTLQSLSVEKKSSPTPPSLTTMTTPLTLPSSSTLSVPFLPSETSPLEQIARETTLITSLTNTNNPIPTTTINSTPSSASSSSSSFTPSSYHPRGDSPVSNLPSSVMTSSLSVETEEQSQSNDSSHPTTHLPPSTTIGTEDFPLDDDDDVTDTGTKTVDPSKNYFHSSFQSLDYNPLPTHSSTTTATNEGTLVDEQIQAIQHVLHQFTDGAPWTIQRLCEILSTPRRYYSSNIKFLHALDGLLGVSSTILPLNTNEWNDRILPTDDHSIFHQCTPLTKPTDVTVVKTSHVSPNDITRSSSSSSFIGNAKPLSIWNETTKESEKASASSSTASFLGTVSNLFNGSRVFGSNLLASGTVHGSSKIGLVDYDDEEEVEEDIDDDQHHYANRNNGNTNIYGNQRNTNNTNELSSSEDKEPYEAWKDVDDDDDNYDDENRNMNNNDASTNDDNNPNTMTHSNGNVLASANVRTIDIIKNLLQRPSFGLYNHFNYHPSVPSSSSLSTSNHPGHDNIGGIIQPVSVASSASSSLTGNSSTSSTSSSAYDQLLDQFMNDVSNTAASNTLVMNYANKSSINLASSSTHPLSLLSSTISSSTTNVPPLSLELLLTTTTTPPNPNPSTIPSSSATLSSSSFRAIGDEPSIHNNVVASSSTILLGGNVVNNLPRNTDHNSNHRRRIPEETEEKDDDDDEEEENDDDDNIYPDVCTYRSSSSSNTNHELSSSHKRERDESTEQESVSPTDSGSSLHQLEQPTGATSPGKRVKEV